MALATIRVVNCRLCDNLAGPKVAVGRCATGAAGWGLTIDEVAAFVLHGDGCVDEEAGGVLVFRVVGVAVVNGSGRCGISSSLEAWRALEPIPLALISTAPRAQRLRLIFSPPPWTPLLVFRMRQSRLGSYFTLPIRRSPSPCLNLLDLPPSVRSLIYEYAGPVGQTIDLNFSNLLVYPYKQYPDSAFALRSRCLHNLSDWPIVRKTDDTAPMNENEYWELEDEGEPCESEVRGFRLERCDACCDGRSLLFVCKAIYNEVVSSIYAKNIFTVRQGSPHGLKRLQLMGDSGIFALTSLTMRLDTNDEQSSFCPDYRYEIAPRPLQLDNKNMRAIFQEHETVFHRLSEHVRPNNLTLYLICRVLDRPTLAQILHPLTKLPLLKECGIWSFVGPQNPSWVSRNARWF
jgi:hypothetical protein